MIKEKKIRAVFVWDYPTPPIDIVAWDDGLHMALRVMKIKYGVEFYPVCTDDTKQIYEVIETVKPDFVLCWGSLDRPSFGGINQFDIPTFLCFAGGSVKHGNRDNFEAIFVENDKYVEEFEAEGYDGVLKAFGVNDATFIPTIQMQPHFEAIYPATFIDHKRHELFAGAVGNKGLAVGSMHEEFRHCINYCLEKGTMVLPKVAYETLPYLIAQSQSVVITAKENGGSQRTVLEAMSMNKPVIVTSDNTRCVEYIKESGVGLIAEPNIESIKDAIKRRGSAKAEFGRKFIESKYTATHYANAMFDRIKKSLQ